MSFFYHEYRSQEQLDGFDKYKYSAIDTNPLSVYVLHPFWDVVVKILPKWIAPNLLTLSGFLLLVLNYILLAYYDFEFFASSPHQKHIPGWVWVVAGTLNFLAYTLDGVDGKQARRTGSSSPLGELFDHGLDSWACLFFASTVYSIFGRGATGVEVVTMHFLFWLVLFSFILSHWEKYNTGVLFLPWGYDISQVTVSIVYFVTAMVGVESWYKPLPFGFGYRELFIGMLTCGTLVMTLPMSLYNVYRAYCSHTLKQSSLLQGLLPLFTPILLFVLCYLWGVRARGTILEVQPRLFYWLVGTYFSNITCKLIVCQMSCTRCQAFNWLLVPLIATVLAVCNGFVGEYEVQLLFALTTFVTLAHIHYGVCVVRQLCLHFRVRAFSLKKMNSE
uniref:ethanolaminephosphotransferase 1 isoform X1 n=1 Tax=Myxine glutinosa TaxID=7769 RepID=UPI00358F183C